MSADWIDIPLAIQAGEGRSTFISDAELVNLMLVPNLPGSQRPFHLLGTPGLLDVNIGEGSDLIRGMTYHSGKVWFVKGASLYYVDGISETQVSGGVGSIAGSAYVQMVGTDTNEIVIVADSNTYMASLTVITEITPPAGTYIDVAYLDGYAVYARSQSDEFYVSALDDPTTIAALDFSTADAVAGRIVGIIADHRELVVFCEQHTEFWYNSGGADFPLSRSSPGVVERGCFSVNTIAKYDNAIFFVGDDRRVYRLEGYRPTPISTPWVDQYLAAQMGGAGDIMAGVYVYDGRAFYVFGIGANKILTYDIGAGLWHLRTHNGISTAHFVGCANEENFVYVAINSKGGSPFGEVYKWDPATYRDSDAGSTDTTRVVTCPAIDGEGERLGDWAALLKAEKVAGTATLKYSDDGGVTYTTHSAISMNQDEVRWSRLGQYRRRNYQLSIEANARVAIHSLRRLAS